METIVVALIAAVAIIVAAGVSIGGQMLMQQAANRRLDALAAVQADLAKVAEATRLEVSAVKTQTNGVMTAAYRAELAAVEAQVVIMKQPKASSEAIAATEARVSVMRKNLADRVTAVSAAQQQIANGQHSDDSTEGT